MKNKIILNLLLMGLAVMLTQSCKKSAEEIELAKLPAATQTGTNTIGCLVNGQAFLPGNQNSYSCSYTIERPTFNVYSISIDCFNRLDDKTAPDIYFGVVKSMTPPATGMTIALGNGYDFGADVDGFGTYTKNTLSQSTVGAYTTKEKVTGQLYISKFDTVNKIISGTFFYDAVDSTGEVVHVTNGRFDMKYLDY